MDKTKTSIKEQIVKAMDGRTKRWLSLEVKIPEFDLSKKLNGKMNFKEDELKRIEERLSFKIER